MWHTLRRLTLGLGLIAFASTILVLSDRPRGGDRSKVPRVALVQLSQSKVIDDSLAGLLAGLAAGGWTDGSTMSLRRYDAGGDIATLNTIAREVVSGGFDLVITVSTPALQAVASANRDGRVRHVFGVVTDPFGAGVGIDRDHPLDHPPQLTGYGSMQPVAAIFRLARQLYPQLARVGVAWNPAEANSEVSVKLARQICSELGIELLEATVETTAGVHEAAASLVARGAEALWVGGDSTAIGAQAVLIDVGRAAGIPTFTSQPGGVDDGALFDLGADYREVGRLTGELAARVLGGLDPATVPVKNVVPELLRINENALKGLSAPWSFPDSVEAQARAASATADAKPQEVAPRRWKVAILEYNSMVEAEESEAGIRDGLAAAGLVEGRDVDVEVANALGDMATLPSLVDAAKTAGADLLMPLATPTLQAALRRVRDRPVVFTLIANPLVTGAGRSFDDHLPYVTGVATATAYREVVELVHEILPGARRIGTLAVPAEANAVYNLERVDKEAKRLGLELEAVSVATSSEVVDAAAALASRDIDAVVQVGSNLTTTTFGAIARAARLQGLPAFGFLGSNLDQGAVAVVARDYRDGGREAGLLAARVLRGEDPGGIPFQPLTTSRLLVDLDAAAEVGLEIPPSVRKRADEVRGGR